MIASMTLALAPLLGLDAPQQDSLPAPKPASPAHFSYTYGQFDLVAGDLDGFSDGPSGIDLRGSYGLTNNIFAFGGLGHLNGDVGNSSKDINTIGVGIGYHTPVDPQTDIWLGFSLLHAETDSGVPNSTPDGDGYAFQVGLRHMLDEKFELDGGLGYKDYDGSDSDTWIEGGLVYNATPKLGLCAGLSLSDNYNSLSIGLRFTP